ncbi:MAG: hypothetical protein U0835_00545 [Isosphaeraceae bacterium]
MRGVLLSLCGLVAVFAVMAWANSGVRQDCLARGGTIVDLPGELLDSCVLPGQEHLWQAG